jgi:hypothetical protein
MRFSRQPGTGPILPSRSDDVPYFLPFFCLFPTFFLPFSYLLKGRNLGATLEQNSGKDKRSSRDQRKTRTRARNFRLRISADYESYISQKSNFEELRLFFWSRNLEERTILYIFAINFRKRPSKGSERKIKRHIKKSKYPLASELLPYILSLCTKS